MKMPPMVRMGFYQGIKSEYDPSSVPPNAMLEAINVRSDDSGILRLRNGCVSVLDEALGTSHIQGGISAFNKLLTIHNKNVYLVDPDAKTAAQIGTNIAADNVSNVNMIRWARGGAEIAYLFPGNGIFQTTGATTTAITPYTPIAGEPVNFIRNSDGSLNTNSGPSRCRIFVLKASLSQRLAATGDPLSPNTIYLSAPLDATYWPSDQIIQLPDDGSKITGMMNWYNALIIFRDRDIWAFFGTDVNASASLVLQDSSVGCPKGETIANVPNVGILFAGPDNIYALQGVTAIENQVKSVPVGNDVAKYYKKALTYGLDGVSAVYFNNEYRLSFPNSIDDHRVFCLSIKNGTMAWYIDSGPQTRAYLVHDTKLYGALGTSGNWVSFEERLNDDGEKIPVRMSFRREDLQPGPSRIKKLYVYALSKGRVQNTELFFMGSSFNQRKVGEEDIDPAAVSVGTAQHLRVQIVADGVTYEVSAFSVTVSPVSFADLANIEPVRIYEFRFTPSLKANFAQIKIFGETPEEDIAILGYGVEYSNRARIHGLKNGVSK